MWGGPWKEIQGPPEAFTDTSQLQVLVSQLHRWILDFSADSNPWRTHQRKFWLGLHPQNAESKASGMG